MKKMITLLVIFFDALFITYQFLLWTLLLENGEEREWTFFLLSRFIIVYHEEEI